MAKKKNNDIWNKLKKEWPALKALGNPYFNADPNFDLRPYGYGAIEHQADWQDTTRYGTLKGYPDFPKDKWLANPAYGTGEHSITYNPNLNSLLDIKLDLLHGMHSDPEYKKHWNAFRDAYKDTKYVHDIKNWWNAEGKVNSYEDYEKNYIDGQIRGMLGQGAPKGKEVADYAQEYWDNPKLKESATTIKNYLETGFENLLPEVTVSPRKFENGGPTDPDLAKVKKGLKYVESSNGLQMTNPKSSATGFYGQLYNAEELQNMSYLQGVDRNSFASDTTLQNRLFEDRYFNRIPDVPGLKRNASELRTEYESQLTERGIPFNYTNDEISALTNLLGREGTRKYFGNVLRDGKSLAEVLPKIYGEDAEAPNKTPEKYLETYREGRDLKYGGKVTKYHDGGKAHSHPHGGVGTGTISRTPGLKGRYLDMMDTPQEYTVKGKPYITSFREELGRTGAEPTMTMTSAGGFGKGYRLYFPYSDPSGLGLEVDVDPTGPGAGMLIDAQKHLEPMLGTEFPPGYGYVGAEVAGNAVAPFVGLTVGQHDIGKLKDWAKEPGREGWETSFNATEHGMGPFLSMWNQGSRLYEGSHLFPKGIHNPLSGTGEGIGGRMGIRGGNLIPHLETPGGKTIVSVRGGAQNLLNEVADIAKSEKIPFKQALNEEYGKAGFEALKKRKGLPTLLDKAGRAVYGTEGAAGYGKGQTLANWLRNIEIPYGKIIEEGVDLGALNKSKSALGQTLGAVANLPGVKQVGSLLKHPIWNPISAALMAPDAMNIFQEALHQKGTSPKGFSLMGRTEGDVGDRPYGAFPSIQRMIGESIEGVEKDKQKKIYDEAQKILESKFGTKAKDIQGATISAENKSEEEAYKEMQQVKDILEQAKENVLQDKKDYTPKQWGPKYKYGGKMKKIKKYPHGGDHKNISNRVMQDMGMTFPLTPDLYGLLRSANYSEAERPDISFQSDVTRVASPLLDEAYVQQMIDDQPGLEAPFDADKILNPLKGTYLYETRTGPIKRSYPPTDIRFKDPEFINTPEGRAAAGMEPQYRDGGQTPRYGAGGDFLAGVAGGLAGSIPLVGKMAKGLVGNVAEGMGADMDSTAAGFGNVAGGIGSMLINPAGGAVKAGSLVTGSPAFNPNIFEDGGKFPPFMSAMNEQSFTGPAREPIERINELKENIKGYEEYFDKSMRKLVGTKYMQLGTTLKGEIYQDAMKAQEELERLTGKKSDSFTRNNYNSLYIPARMRYGGQANVDLEAEAGEVVVGNATVNPNYNGGYARQHGDLPIFTLGGKSHAQGGIGMNVTGEDPAYIFSNNKNLKVPKMYAKGGTYADAANTIGKELADISEMESGDVYDKTTASRMKPAVMAKFGGLYDAQEKFKVENGFSNPNMGYAHMGGAMGHTHDNDLGMWDLGTPDFSQYETNYGDQFATENPPPPKGDKLPWWMYAANLAGPAMNIGKGLFGKAPTLELEREKKQEYRDFTPLMDTYLRGQGRNLGLLRAGLQNSGATGNQLRAGFQAGTSNSQAQAGQFFNQLSPQIEQSRRATDTYNQGVMSRNYQKGAMEDQFAMQNDPKNSLALGIEQAGTNLPQLGMDQMRLNNMGTANYGAFGDFIKNMFDAENS